ncbi:MAG: STN domain-containing protein, partial [Rhodothermales bacterium]
MSSFCKACRVVGAGLIALSCCGQAGAQTPAPAPGQAEQGQAVPATYSFVLRGVPMEAALQQLVRTTQIDLAYDPALVAAKQVYCVAEEQPAEAVLRCVLQGSGLDFYRLSSGMY